MQKIQILLIEDEHICQCEFKDYLDEQKKIKTDYPIDLVIADGEAKGLSLIQKIPFEVIILDLELSESDGDGLVLLEKLKLLILPKRPYIIVSSNNRSPLTKEAVRNLGADYYFCKNKSDFSPELIFNYILAIYHSYDSVEIPNQKRGISLADEIRILVTNIGLTDNLIGKAYVIDAILIVIKNKNSEIILNRDVFPIISRKYNKSVNSINRAIESAINKAWNISCTENRLTYYKAAVSGSKGTPTNKEFIFTLAQQIKYANTTNP